MITADSAASEAVSESRGTRPAHVALEIQVLPDHVVDQIAAGEVVERPASVVKELVENALDAGAMHITVEVESGGRSLVRVVDDGCGMTGAQLSLALQRHATSKLRSVGDLFGLTTMGFRGEALPSIASVSRMSIRTRTKEQVAGSLVTIEGGVVVARDEVGAPVGTLIEVRDLLYNVPARQKFMKGQATEASHITDAVTKLALAHHGVHISLAHGARTSVNAPPHATRLERARVLLGSRLGRRLHRVSGDENGVHVEAFLAAPSLAQSTSRGVQLFVGARSVRDRGMLHAVRMGYGELVPKGRYPVCVLFVDAPASDLDINVHPQKLEVRFSDAQRVYAAVRHLLARGIADAPWLADGPEEDGALPVRMRAIASSAPPRAAENAAGFRRGPRETARTSSYSDDYAARRMQSLWGRPRNLKQNPFPVAQPSSSGDPGADITASTVAETSLSNPANVEPTAGSDDRLDRPHESAPPSRFFSSLQYRGQLDRTFLLCENNGELVLIDQHAAHERVAFQRLRERHQQRAVPVQRLLFPKRMQLEPQLAAVATDSADALAAVGFELEPFGGNTFALKAVPAGLRNSGGPEKQPVAVLEELLGELVQHGGSRAVEDRLNLALATIACHSVVRAGDTLSHQEARALLDSMDAVDFADHCPHGRPVLLRISIAEIARRFGR